jgi:hypothetical protein
VRIPWFAIAATTVAVAIPDTAAVAQQAPIDTLPLAIRVFLAERIEASIPLFTAALRRDSGDATRHAWLAEAARRTERWSLAASEAYRALALEPCNGFAHTVLSDLYDPIRSGWDAAQADSSWFHAREAVRCDPSEGSAWMTVWIGALSRADTALERQALAALARERFITLPYQTHARWVLESAPRRAVLIANGDLDTYPPAAAQAAQGIRPDVVVVNRNLLNLRWYAELMRDRFGLPLPPPEGTDTALTASDVILRDWKARAVANTLGRPLAILNTVGQPDVGRLAGPFWVVDSTATAGDADRRRIAASLRRADALDWRGPAVSGLDRSPVRNARTRHPALWVAYLALLHCDATFRAGDRADAREWLRWTERFLVRAGIPAQTIDEELAPMRDWLGRNPG